MMASIPLVWGVLVSAIVALASAASTPPPGVTPVTTCCPPGSFLAIEDWQGSRQQPDGIWGDLRYSGNMPQPTPRIAALKKLRGWCERRCHSDDWSANLKSQFGRHNFINRVYCVPDKNNLPDIHAFKGSSYPKPPYWATWLDKVMGRKTFENYTLPLAENQTLWSQGDQLPSCPGGPDELATIVLGDGHSSGYNTGSVSPFLRLNEGGRILGKYLDVLGTSEGLRLGMQLPERYKTREVLFGFDDDGSGKPKLPPPDGQETEVEANFCLTWSTDPRTKLVPYDPSAGPAPRGPDWSPRVYPAKNLMRERGPLHLLEAVYCDPCKAKVACSLITTHYWHQVQKFFDLGFWGAQTPPPGVEDSPDWGADEAVDPRSYPKWAPPVWAFLPYLDEDRNGKVTIKEFYDLKFVRIMRIVFDGLDANADGVVKKNEARLRSFLRVPFIRSSTKELFDLMDVNKDGYLSVDDIPSPDYPSYGPSRGPSHGPSHRPSHGPSPDYHSPDYPDYSDYPDHHSSHHSSDRRSLTLGTKICPVFPQAWMQNACHSLMTTYFNTLVDKDSDTRVSLAEFQDPWIRLLQFFVVDPSKEVDVRQLVGRLEQLWEPQHVVASLTQLLGPILETFPKMVLLSLVESADKNANEEMEWEEFEGLTDFELVFEKWPKMWTTLQREMIPSGMQMGSSDGDKSCFPSYLDLFRYFTSTEVIVRLFHNLFHHQDFQFPSWSSED